MDDVCASEKVSKGQWKMLRRRTDKQLRVQKRVSLQSEHQLCLHITDNSKTLLPAELIWLQQAPVQLANRIQSEGVVVFEREDESIS